MSSPTSATSPTVLAVAVILGVLATSFSSIFINIGLPMLTHEFAISTAQSHWLVSIFITASTLSLLLTSQLISQYSIRHTFLWFLAIFIATSIIAGVGHNFYVLIACRAAQGASMGVLSVVAIVAMYQAYPIERRGHAGAIFGIGIAMGPTLGPTVGGMLVELGGWRSVFFAPLPLALISFFLCQRILPNDTVASDKRFDSIGFILISLAILGTMSSLSYLQQQHWPAPTSIMLLVLMTALFIGFYRQQQRHEQPLLHIALFKYPTFAIAAVIAFVYGMGLWGSAFFVPLYLQNALHMSAWDTGMVMLPSGLFLCLVLPLAGHMADTMAPRIVVSIGLFAFGAALTLLGLGYGQAGFISLAALITLSRGLGLGMMIPSLDATATRALPSEALSEGVAIMNFLRQLGGALSPALLMAILEWRSHVNGAEAIVANYHHTAMAIGALFLACIIASMMLPNKL